MEVDHVTVYRRVVRFTPLLADAARLCRHSVGSRWWVDETYVKVAGRWRYVHRAIDQSGQIVDVLSPCGVMRRQLVGASSGPSAPPGSLRSRSSPTTRRCTWACSRNWCQAPGIVPTRTLTIASRRTTGRLKARLGPMRALEQDRNAAVIIAGHAFIQSIRRGHYELAVEAPVRSDPAECSE